jgi:hypothetical protein
MNFKKKPLLWLTIASLATWRITSIIHREKIAAPLRAAVGIMPVGEDDDDPAYWIYPDNFVGKLFYCTWCLSVWVGGIVAALLYLWPPVLLPFALSTLSIFQEKIIEYLGSLPYVFVEELDEEDQDTSSE